MVQLLERPRPDADPPHILCELEVLDAVEHTVAAGGEEVVAQGGFLAVAVGVGGEIGRVHPRDVRERVLVVLETVDEGEGQRAHRELGVRRATVWSGEEETSLLRSEALPKYKKLCWWDCRWSSDGSWQRVTVFVSFVRLFPVNTSFPQRRLERRGRPT